MTPITSISTHSLLRYRSDTTDVKQILKTLQISVVGATIWLVRARHSQFKSSEFKTLG